jgi:ABC-type multidrug transport system fused ATPase/permease subunit
MLAGNPMLILDEATSSVDTRNRVLIQKAMDTLMKGKNTFLLLTDCQQLEMLIFILSYERR